MTNVAYQLGQDARVAARLARRFPLFTAIVVLTIALGVGATTAIFSAVNAVVLAPLPFANSQRLVSLWGTNPDKSVPRFGVSWPDFRDWKQRTRSFDDMALYVGNVTTLIESNEPESVADLYVTSNFLDVLGIRPILGRGFGSTDERGESSNTVLLSHGYWLRRFAGNHNVIGRAISVAGRPRTIIGVLPPEAQLLGPAFVGAPLDVMTVIELTTYSSVERHAQHLFGAVARLRSGVTIDNARVDLNATELQIAKENPEIAGWSASTFFLADDLALSVREPLLLLLAASALLLLIACINVANLLLVRGSARAREIAVRRALGASRGRLVAQFTTESLLLALVGAIAGIGIAAVAMRAIRGMLPFGIIAQAAEIRLSGTALGFALTISVMAALIFGVVPLTRRGTGLGAELRDRTRSASAGGRAARRILVIAEFSLALVLLVCAGLVAQSFRRMVQVDPGFKSDHVVTAALTLGKDYPDSSAVAFYRRFLGALEARPGIVAAGATDAPPLSGGGIFTAIRLIGEPPRPPDQPLMSTIRSVTPGYFRAMGMRVTAGEDLSWDEPTVSMVVSTAAAKAFWPGAPATGKQVAFNTQPTSFPVIGEVNDTRQASLATAPAPIVYISMRRYARVFHTMTLVVRGRGEVASTVAAIRATLRDADPNLPLYNVQTMQSIVDQSTAEPRLNMALLGAFAGVALVLAVLGVYGVISFGVTQRSQEIGVRLALGARASDVTLLVLREGGMLALAGVVIGLTGAWLASRLIQSMLFEIRPTDPRTLATSAAVLVIVACMASYIPARRAARIDPVQALRAD